MDLVAGKVASVVVDNAGTNYSANPVVTFSGGGATSQAIAIATVDTVPTSPTFGRIAAITPTGADYYEIELGEYTQQMHTDLSPTTLRGYRQTNMGGTPFSYLGPVVVAERNKPVRVKFTNSLSTGTGGNLFIPVDTTVMGSGMFETNDPANPANIITGEFTQNRATLHLHGNNSPWISDGTPHQWITPAGEATSYPQGVSVYNIPDMPDGGVGNRTDGASTFYYTNQQSARLMFYHDHSFGITRLNVYVGEAAGYLITDQVEKDMINGTNVTGVNPSGLEVLPDAGIPLVIQDKSFIDPTTIAAQDPTWMGPVTESNLWYPHVYMPNQNPYDAGGMNAFGRWHYGPWFWPPTNNIANPPVSNEYYQPDPTLPNYDPAQLRPDTPNPSTPMEAFQDTPVVNGMAYPYLEVEPKAYRFRILNAADDRFFNLQMYQANPGIVSGISLVSGGSGYTDPAVSINDPSPAATGATATAIVENGVIIGVTLDTVGSGYTAPTVAFTDPNPAATGASATATVYTGSTEVGMVPATDGRAGGVPDPAMTGPEFIQIGTEGGFLPAPTVLPNQPVEWNLDPTTFDFGDVNNGTLILGTAERADVVVDFSTFAGQTIVLYNDSPAPFPALDPRYDYYTGDPNQTDVGGAPTTQPGYGPNTRTIMTFTVGTTVTTPTTDVTLGNLEAVFKKTAGKRGVFEVSQDEIIVPEGRYDTAYNKTFPNEQYFRIFDSVTKTFKTVSGATVERSIEPKAIQDEMGEAFDMVYGRQNSSLGLEMPFTGAATQQFVLYPFASPPVEIVKNTVYGTPLEVLSDGTQIWKITHNGVDTHTIHTHLFNAQLINRVAWDNNIRPPDANELGWKETFRVNPLQDTIIALRPVAPTNLPFQVPNSVRLIDVTKADGAPLDAPSPTGEFFDPTGDPIVAFGAEGQINNHYVNFGWEYVYHCHLLAHEEMDMMHSVVFGVPPEVPTNLTAVLKGSNVTLTWMDNSLNETTFTIQRRVNGGAWTTIAIVPGTLPGAADTGPVTYRDRVTKKGTYYYQIIANNLVGDTVVPVFPNMSVDSGPSNVVTVVR
jgi:FtsP/CotA-like multicopper oxidase with cupredoxin domain